MGTKNFRTRLGVNRLECREVAASMTASFTIPESPIGRGHIGPKTDRPAILLPTKIVYSEVAQVQNRGPTEPNDEPPAEMPMLEAELIGETDEIELLGVVALNEDGTPYNG